MKRNRKSFKYAVGGPVRKYDTGGGEEEPSAEEMARRQAELHSGMLSSDAQPNINLNMPRYRKPSDLKTSAILGAGAGLLSAGIRTIPYMIGNERKRKSAWDKFQTYQNDLYSSGIIGGGNYPDWKTYCETNECPSFENFTPNYGDFKSGQYGNIDNWYRREGLEEDWQRKDKIMQSLKKSGRDAITTGVTSYLWNKAMKDTRWGRKLQNKLGMDLDFSLNFKDGGRVPRAEFGYGMTGTRQEDQMSQKEGTWFGGFARSLGSTIVDPLGLGYGSKWMGMDDKDFKGWDKFTAGREGFMEDAITTLDPTGITDWAYDKVDNLAENTSPIHSKLGRGANVEHADAVGGLIGETGVGIAKVATGDLSGIGNVMSAGSNYMEYKDPGNTASQYLNIGSNLAAHFNKINTSTGNVAQTRYGGSVPKAQDSLDVPITQYEQIDMDLFRSTPEFEEFNANVRDAGIRRNSPEYNNMFNTVFNRWYDNTSWQYDEDDMMTAIMGHEHRGPIDEDENYSPWIRTKHSPDGGSSAYGPYQLTGGSGSMIANQLGYYDKGYRPLGATITEGQENRSGVIGFTDNEIAYMRRFQDQGNLFLTFGGGDYKQYIVNDKKSDNYGKVKYDIDGDGTDEYTDVQTIKDLYEYGGTGHLTSDDDKALYESIARKLFNYQLEEFDGDWKMAVDSWKGGANRTKYENMANLNRTTNRGYIRGVMDRLNIGDDHNLKRNYGGKVPKAQDSWTPMIQGGLKYGSQGGKGLIEGGVDIGTWIPNSNATLSFSPSFYYSSDETNPSRTTKPIVDGGERNKAASFGLKYNQYFPFDREKRIAASGKAELGITDINYNLFDKITEQNQPYDPNTYVDPYEASGSFAHELHTSQPYVNLGAGLRYFGGGANCVGDECNYKTPWELGLDYNWGSKMAQKPGHDIKFSADRGILGVDLGLDQHGPYITGGLNIPLFKHGGKTPQAQNSHRNDPLADPTFKMWYGKNASREDVMKASANPEKLKELFLSEMGMDELPVFSGEINPYNDRVDKSKRPAEVSYRMINRHGGPVPRAADGRLLQGALGALGQFIQNDPGGAISSIGSGKMPAFAANAPQWSQPILDKIYGPGGYGSQLGVDMSQFYQKPAATQSKSMTWPPNTSAKYGRSVHPDQQYEAEAGEVVSYSNGGAPTIYGGGRSKNISPGMVSLTGNTHEQGGIDMSGGDFVFSDNKELLEYGTYPSDILKKYNIV